MLYQNKNVIYYFKDFIFKYQEIIIKHIIYYYKKTYFIIINLLINLLFLYNCHKLNYMMNKMFKNQMYLIFIKWVV